VIYHAEFQTHQEDSIEEFFGLIDTLTYQNEDILEAIDFGFDSVQDAFKEAERHYSRLWTIAHEGTVLTTILEQRDGTLVFFSTEELKGRSIRRYVKVLRKLVRHVTKCREVVFVRVAAWYKPAQKLLKTVGFKPMVLENHYSIWVYEYGKQD
jgi:hypothetical protein